MVRHGADVLHHLHRQGKDAGIEALQDVPTRCLALEIFAQPGVIDQACAPLLGLDKCSGDLELR